MKVTIQTLFLRIKTICGDHLFLSLPILSGHYNIRYLRGVCRVNRPVNCLSGIPGFLSGNHCVLIPSVISFRDNVKRLRDLQPPVLLARGTGSDKWFHNANDIFKDNFSHSGVVEFSGGDAPYIVSNDKFISEVEEFSSAAVK